MSLKKFSEIGVGIAFKKVIKKENLARVVSRFRKFGINVSRFRKIWRGSLVDSGNLVQMSVDLEKSGAGRQIFCYRLENVYVIIKTYERANTKV